MSARVGELGEVAYVILLLGGVAALLAAAYCAYLSRLPAAIALTLVGIVMIVLAV